MKFETVMETIVLNSCLKFWLKVATFGLSASCHSKTGMLLLDLFISNNILNVSLM